MTPQERPDLYHAWLSWAMDGCPPDPHGENGNNAKTHQTRKGPESSCPPRDDGCGSPPREAVEAQLGRASQ